MGPASTVCLHIYVQSSTAGTDELNVDLEIALNYGQATGAAQLLRFVTEHTEVYLM
jgi:aromatic amino acid aminotransferase I